jgi:glycosyltransferase involved in cell wall biosynthesis
VSADVPAEQGEHLVSVVIPVYRGEHHLPGVLEELAPYTASMTTPGGVRFRVAEVLMVNDCGPDDSARVMRELEGLHPFARSVWLSRNFGQHAATLAGMASAGGDWIVTLDEDGQHDPAFIATMLDAAMTEQASVVYARPTNTPPHSALRNLTSRGAE